MDKKELQKVIKRFKKYYSKHLNRFSYDECNRCPLNEGLAFGMYCDSYFYEIFGLEGYSGCYVRREKSKSMLKKECVKRVNKI